MDLTIEEHRELQHALEGDLEIPPHLTSRFTDHLQHCRECQRVLQTTGKLRESLMSNFQASAHLSKDQLLFLLTAESLHAQMSLADRNTLRQQRAHLRKCSLCRLREQFLRKELQSCDEVVFGTKEKLPESSALMPPQFDNFAAPPPRAEKRSLSSLGKVFAGVGLGMASYLILFAISMATLPAHYRDIDPNAEDYASSFSPLMGGEDKTNIPDLPQKDKAGLQAAQDALYSGKFQQAFAALSRVNESELRDQHLLRFRLYELTATLYDSHSDFLLLFPHFDKPRIADALAKMNEALATMPNPAGEINHMYLGPAYYFAAKACLILDRPQEACNDLEHCVNLSPHVRRNEAQTLRKKLGCN